MRTHGHNEDELPDAVVRMYRESLDDDGLDFLRRGPRTAAEQLAFVQRVHPEAHRATQPAPRLAQAVFLRHGALDRDRHFVGPDGNLYVRNETTVEPLHASIRRGFETAVPGFQRMGLGELLAQADMPAPVGDDSTSDAAAGWRPAYKAGPMRMREIAMWSSQAEPEDVGDMAQRDRMDVLRLLRHRDETGSISPSERDLAGAISGGMRMGEDLWAHQRPKDELFQQLLTVDPAVQRGMAAWGKLDDQQRLAALDRIGRLAAQTYGFDAPTSTLADLGQRDPDGVTVLGDYSRDKNAVRFNQNEVGLRDRMLETAVHEAMHAYERFLVDQFLGNRISTQDPRYGLAQTLALSQPFYVQYTADRRRDHELQPSESYVRSLASQATASLSATRNQWRRSRH